MKRHSIIRVARYRKIITESQVKFEFLIKMNNFSILYLCCIKDTFIVKKNYLVSVKNLALSGCPVFYLATQSIIRFSIPKR